MQVANLQNFDTSKKSCVAAHCRHSHGSSVIPAHARKRLAVVNRNWRIDSLPVTQYDKHRRFQLMLEAGLLLGLDYIVLAADSDNAFANIQGKGLEYSLVFDIDPVYLTHEKNKRGLSTTKDELL